MSYGGWGLAHYHGSPAVSQWSVVKTMDRIRSKHWLGMAEAVRGLVMGCLKTCTTKRLSKPLRAQGPLQAWHPRRRFELVALMISPRSKQRARKVVVTVDLLIKFLVAVPRTRETGGILLQKVFQNRWLSVFGPPEELLTDQGQNLRLAGIEALVKPCGVWRLFTSPYHPQTISAVEWLHRRLCRDLEAVSAQEIQGGQQIGLFCCTDSSAVNSATGVTQC